MTCTFFFDWKIPRLLPEPPSPHSMIKSELKKGKNDIFRRQNFRFYFPFPKLFFFYHWMGGKGAHAWDALSLVAWTCTNSEKTCTFIANYRRVEKVEIRTGAKRDDPEELCFNRAERWKWWNLIFTFFWMRKFTGGSRRCFAGKFAPPKKIVAKTHHPENSV